MNHSMLVANRNNVMIGKEKLNECNLGSTETNELVMVMNNIELDKSFGKITNKTETDSEVQKDAERKPIYVSSMILTESPRLQPKQRPRNLELSRFPPIPEITLSCRDTTTTTHDTKSNNQVSAPCSPLRRSIFNDYWSKQEQQSIEKQRDDNLSPLTLPESAQIAPATNNLSPSTPPRPSILRRSHSHSISPPPSLFLPPLSHEDLRRTQSHSIRSMKRAGKRLFDFPRVHLPNLPTLSNLNLTNQNTEDDNTNNPCVHFDPLISVVEFEGEEDCKHHQLWFTEEELNRFKHEAISQALRCMEYTHSGSPRLNSSHNAPLSPRRKALFANPALRATPEETLIPEGSYELIKLLREEIINVLVVDSSDGTRMLFKKAMKHMMPHVRVYTAKSGEEALENFFQVSDVQNKTPKPTSEDSNSSFDIVIAQERSHHVNKNKISGSQLLQEISIMEEQREMERKGSNDNSRRPLLIGVSPFLGEDCDKLRRGGADLLWGKPLPKMNNSLRNEMLNTLLSKRGHNFFVCG